MDAVQSCLVFPLLPVYSPHLVKDLDGVLTRPCLPTSPPSSVGVRWLFFIVCHLVVRSKVAVLRWHLYRVVPDLRRMVCAFSIGRIVSERAAGFLYATTGAAESRVASAMFKRMDVSTVKF
jgi:hypothetical protein